MQSASCLVRLADVNGPSTSPAFKASVTPAEVVILRSFHGDDAVIDVKPFGENDRRSHASELERLRSIYHPAVVASLFPGHSPNLPSTFREIGIDVADEEEESAPARKSRGKGKAAAADADVGDGKYDPAIDGE